MPELTKHERVRAALEGDPVDRVPVSFWGHDYLREWSAEGTTAAMVETIRRFDWDFLKVNPRATYYAEAWGCRYRPSGTKTEGPVCESWVLHTHEDLGRIAPVDPRGGPFAEQLEALRLIAEGLAGQTPFIQTVFSPLATLGLLANRDVGRVREWMRFHPEAVERALGSIAETLAGYARACVEAGAAGVFFATVEWGTSDNLTPEEFARFSRPYDLTVLKAAQDGWFNVLHVCRRNNLLEAALDYPVHAFSWSIHEEGNPPFRTILRESDKAVLGGIDQRTLLDGTPEQVRQQTEEALVATGGRRLLLGPGCSISPLTPEANLRAVIAAVRART